MLFPASCILTPSFESDSDRYHGPFANELLSNAVRKWKAATDLQGNRAIVPILGPARFLWVATKDVYGYLSRT